MPALDRLLEMLRETLAHPAATRDGVLRLGFAAFLLAVYVLVPLLILRDRAREDEAPEGAPVPEPAAAAGAPQGSSVRTARIGVAYASSLAVLVALFPFAYAAGLHGALAAIALLATLAAGPDSASRRLRLQAPRAPTRAEVLGLLAVCASVAVLTLWRWAEVPVGMHGDEAKCGLAAVHMYRQGANPFFLNEAGVPAFLQTLDGLALRLVDDRLLGLRLVPLLCAVVSPIVLFRWLRLIGPPALAWMGTIAFVTTPFFQHASRTPTGVTLVFAQLVFLYGFTRALAAPGWVAPVVGGIGLGIAQWDYYASRMLLVFLAVSPLLLLPYRKQLARGWWRRLLLLALVAAPLVFCFTLMVNYSSHGWRFYLFPRSEALPPSDLPLWRTLMERLALHVPMWFSAVDNKVGAITVPGSPVLPYPQGALGLVGLGVLAASAGRAPAALVAALLLLGLVPSLLTDGPPNGHRMMTAEVPVAVLLGLALCALWPGERRSDPRWTARLRIGLAAAALTAACVAGVRYYQVDMWAFGGNVWAQEIDANLRARRLREDAAGYDRRLVTPIHPVERYLLDDLQLPVLDFGHWLPANWSATPLSVNGLTARQALVGLPRSALRPDEWEEFAAVDGLPAGWRYRTDGQRLGSEEVARQWRERRSVSGSLMIPDAGTLRVRCPGYRLTYRTPLLGASVSGAGAFPVHRGLATLEIAPLSAPSGPPDFVELSYEPAGHPAQDHRLRPQDLFAVPVQGWLRQVFVTDDKQPSRDIRTESAVLPTLFVWWGIEEEWPKEETERRRTRYSAIASLPPGAHRLIAYVNPPRAVRVRVGPGEIVPFPTPDALQDRYEFVLDARRDNGRLVEITRVDDQDTRDVSRFSLLIRLEGRDEVPPYGWFRPAAGEESR